MREKLVQYLILKLLLISKSNLVSIDMGLPLDITTHSGKESIFLYTKSNGPFDLLLILCHWAEAKKFKNIGNKRILV